MTLLWVVGLLLIGLIAGGIARIFVHTGARLGCLGTALLGVLGSYVGGSLGAVLFDERLDLRRSHTFLGAILGSIIALVILRAVNSARRR
ncbi:MAG TPA: GlsB/YeaQ/YmgE family stress response membrane protein [Mycobacteriales bacterium]|jgi:Predicted membrane protein